MNTAKLNPLIDLTEVEISSCIEFTYPLAMFMILVTAMTTVNPQILKKSCGSNVLNISFEEPYHIHEISFRIRLCYRNRRKIR